MRDSNQRKRIAVVGVSCRFAGADNPDELWNVMEKMSYEVTPMNTRFKDSNMFYSGDIAAHGKYYNQKSCFLKRDIYRFDADFFEISRKEACHMDVQQRMLLEVSYEALEDAGLIINGSSAGVFIGGFMQDHLTNTMQRHNFYNLNQYDTTGTSLGMLSGKISYFYDLHGPSITIDTACSSSLTALHYACESIAHGTCDTAICGGVNILTDMGNFITLSKGKFLSKNRYVRLSEKARTVM